MDHASPQAPTRAPGRTDGRRVDRLTHQEQWAVAADAIDCECYPRQAERCKCAGSCACHAAVNP